MFANRTARWIFGTVAVCALLAAVGWFLLVSPRRTDAADLRDETESSQSQAVVLEAQIAELKSEAADLPAQKAKLGEIARQLTPDADVPEFVRTLQGIAADTGVDLTAISPGTPAVVTTTDTTSTDSSSTDTTSTDTSGALAEAGTLVSVPVSLNLSGDLYQVIQFLKRIQTRIDRSFVISGLTLAQTEVESTDGVSLDSTGLSGASVSATQQPLSAAAATSAAATSTAKGSEGSATATDGSTATSTDGSTADAGVSDATATTEASTTQQDLATLTVTGAVYVLLDGTSTLEDVQQDAADAAAATTATPSVATTTSAD